MDRWQQVQDIFEQALQQSPAQREALLAAACRDDADLRAEVESLLKHHDESGDDFMRPPVPPPTVPPFAASPQPGATVLQDSQSGATVPHRPDPLIGQQIDAWRIERVLATGGMGTVYLAEQQQQQRLVALKLLRAGLVASSALLRFEYEAEILARLRHPNIAQVYAAGTAEVIVAQRPSAVSSACPAEDGWTTSVPYFAMEYIPAARLITEYADQEGLDARGRLRLFEQVCEAVHHGHQRGVIHRDLKPANILVDAAGRVKVIDFGVARATDADIALTTLRTETGQLIGTLQYMSPEQCHADPLEIDTRSDVYSLGVVLYELLCGRLPYDVTRTPIPTAARVICEQSPPRPSAITGRRAQGSMGLRPVSGSAGVPPGGTGTPQCGTGFQPVSDKRCGTAASAVVPPVKGDLERIILTALEKDRDQRYQSAADLLRNIRHYLNREPIEAKPPTLWTRTLRWVARHPALATTATCLTIAALVFTATAVSVWWYNLEPAFIDRVTRTGEVKETSNGFKARLWSRSHRLLESWSVPPGAEVTEACLVDKPEEFGGGKLVLLSFANALNKYEYGNALAAFDPQDSLEKPVWVGALKDEERMPVPPYARDRDYQTHEFNAFILGLWDIFTEPDHPGDEIVVVFNHKVRSQRIVRIYDLEGELLYQIWHDGSIRQCYWMAEERLLVCLGTNGERRWDEWGWDFEGREHPRVVFAIQPEPGEILEEFLATSPDDDSLDPAWYYWLAPPEFLADLERPVEILLVDPGKAKSGRAVGLSFRFWDETGKCCGGISWDIDATGQKMAESRSLADGYKKYLENPPPDDLNRLPEPNEFCTLPWPPSKPG